MALALPLVSLLYNATVNVMFRTQTNSARRQSFLKLGDGSSFNFRVVAVKMGMVKIKEIAR